MAEGLGDRLYAVVQEEIMITNAIISEGIRGHTVSPRILATIQSALTSLAINLPETIKNIVDADNN